MDSSGKEVLCSPTEHHQRLAFFRDFTYILSNDPSLCMTQDTSRDTESADYNAELLHVPAGT